VVENHESDGDRDQELIKLPYQANGGGLGTALRNVNLADGKTGSGAGVALTAGFGEVFRVDHGAGVGGRQDVVNAMATGAVGDGLGAGLGGQPVEGGIEATQ